ncbi:MAG: 23S rRNA (guanosine(2251)-2'-O)-methyltransferase RlmB [Actinobacteria bacterium]|nr:23S rRNA (guanosine(2251)-2'-O)-methyltransferase RlmB [Actinomycetota bacterium]
MAGNSSRRGAVRKPSTKKAKVVGAGGRNKSSLEGRGPTPKAVDRPYHPAAKKAAAAKKSVAKKAAPSKSAPPSRAKGASAAGGRAEVGRAGRTEGGRAPASRGGAPASRGGAPRAAASRGGSTRSTSSRTSTSSSRSTSSRTSTSSRAPRKTGRPAAGDWVIGRNATLEALQAGIPVDAVYVMTGIDMDERIREVLDICRARRLNLLDASRSDLDRMTNKSAHQGLAMRVPAYTYADASTFPKVALPLIMVLDGITDTRNLGAIIRSCAAFGATGVVISERRAASVTPAAWKTSAGAAARIPVAQVTNIARTLKEYKQAGCFVIGMDADGDDFIHEAAAKLCDGPTVIVIGAEGDGISRLVRETCDIIAQIPMTTSTESLNASVAASVALYEAARVRR